MFGGLETGEGHSGCVLVYESSILRDLDVRHICVHRRQRRPVPGQSLQSFRVAY